MSLKDFWDEQADVWSRFARTPGHDAYHEGFNFPAFLDLVPDPGRRTLDLGCGEGRVGAELARRGHDVVGVDSSERMVELAREHHEALVADAVSLPFENGAFDLVAAYMSVMNFDDPEGAIREVGRVLETRGRFCFAIVHPIDVAGAFTAKESDAPFVISGSYFEPETRRFHTSRNGIEMTFLDRGLPVERLARACEDAGLLVEAIREPRPSDAFVEANPIAARRRRIPLFLHLRAVKP